MRGAKCDWLVVYADREHLANIAFLSRYDPRFRLWARPQRVPLRDNLRGN